jgi:hypothetical protein
VLALGVLAAGVIPSAAALAQSTYKTIRYRGLALQVPVSWPVFRLSGASTTCVRFNRHAVYLGRPGSDQLCPASALGRTEAILVRPARAGSASGSATTSSVTGSELSLVRHGLAVTATWAHDPAVLRRALGLRSLPRAQDAGPRPAAATMAVRASARSRSGVGFSRYTGLAFDTCSAPSSAELGAWKNSPYRGMGVYIGGANAACAQSNLDSGWVSSVTGMGWHLLLIYVGLQAPGNSCGCAALAPGSAASEGRAAADDAAGRASGLGVGRGSPIYFDMEGYGESPSTRSAVLRFLAAWTAELHRDGYRSGVYSSADSGIADLVSRYGSGYEEPNDLWFAAWDGQASTAASYIPAHEWADHQRVHQYSGAHNLRYGGYTMNVDGDYVDAGTVGAGSSGSSSPPPPTPSPTPAPKPRHHHHHRPPKAHGNPTANGAFVEVRGTGAVYRIVGGAPLLVRHWRDIGGPRRVHHISRRRFRGLRAVPADGSIAYTATGTAYVIVGGFPFALTSPAPRHSRAQLVDLWDFQHLSNPLVHLKPTPSDGTVVEGAPSAQYWLFENGQMMPAQKTGNAISVPDSDLATWLPGCTWSWGDCSGGAGYPNPQPNNGWHWHGHSGGGGFALRP